MVGPKESGKTTLANFLANMTENLNQQEPKYEPTVGLRVLEFEPQTHQSMNVELWDVSGDHVYENCWPAVMKDAHGVVIMYDPSDRLHEQEVALWYEYFVQNADLANARCLIFAHKKGQEQSSGRPPAMSGPMNAVKRIMTNFESPGVIRREFDSFVARVADL